MPQIDWQRVGAGLRVEVRYSAAGTELGHISSLGQGPFRTVVPNVRCRRGSAPGHDSESAAEPVTGVSRCKTAEGTLMMIMMSAGSGGAPAARKLTSEELSVLSNGGLTGAAAAVNNAVEMLTQQCMQAKGLLYYPNMITAGER